MKITQEYLRDIFSYKDGFLYWYCPMSNSLKKGDLAGSVNKRNNGDRRVICIGQDRYLASRLIFIYHHGYIPEFVDHIDRNTLNDRIENLRPATRSENNRNRSANKSSSSKYLGVCFYKNGYNAQIKGVYIGRYKTEIEAAIAYNNEAKKLYGDFANLNIVGLL